MESAVVSTVAGAALGKTENEVASVLFHLRKLLRIKNQLCSPLLQLPTETIVHILSYIMEHLEIYAVWWPIFTTCHRIFNIMCTTTELWWKLDCGRVNAAEVAFLRSNGSPQMIVADLAPCWNPSGRAALSRWRDRRVFHSDRLRKLDLSGHTYDIARFFWIFKRPLPRLNYLKIHFSPQLPYLGMDNSGLPVAWQLPVDVPLRVLDLRNTTLPWASNLFPELNELRLDFRDCHAAVEILEDELLGILGTSSRLEYLSLMRIGLRTSVGDTTPQFSHKGVVQLPRLAFLELDDSPEVVGYILIHLDLPAIASLWICSPVSSRNIAQSLDLLTPDDHLRKRLFSNPPIFGIGTSNEELADPIVINIGSFGMQLDIDADAVNICRPIMTRIRPLVPPSITVLRVRISGWGLDEAEWKEFFSSHQGFRSIECFDPSEPSTGTLWAALSPPWADAVTLCPRLTSISLPYSPRSPHLRNCLLSRRNAGFRLKYLKVKISWDVPRLAEEFSLLVEALQVDGDGSAGQNVCPVPDGGTNI